MKKSKIFHAKIEHSHFKTYLKLNIYSLILKFFSETAILKLAI